MSDVLKQGEVLNDLLSDGSLKIIQHPQKFNFSLDSVLVADFATIKKTTKKVADLGTGNGAIALYLSTKLPSGAKVDAVELQSEIVDMAKRNVKLNNLEDLINVHQMDMKDAPKNLGYEKYDLVVCNPPFFKVDKESNLNKNDYLTIARHEVMVNIEQVVNTAKGLLKYGGVFTLVHRPDRIDEILHALFSQKMSVRKIRFVHPKVGKPANIVLIEAKKETNTGGVKVLEPLYAFDEKTNQYSQEVKKIYKHKT